MEPTLLIPPSQRIPSYSPEGITFITPSPGRSNRRYKFPGQPTNIGTAIIPTELRTGDEIQPPVDLSRQPSRGTIPPKNILSTSPVKGKQPICSKYKGLTNYGTLTEFAKGGFGTIDRTSIRVDNKDVLSKKIKALTRTGDLDPYLIRETSITITVESPMTIKILDIKIINDVAEIFIPYGGNSLFQEKRLRGNTPAPEERFKPFLYDCFVALAYLASLGVIHCDIKPANIVNNSNVPLIIDFGAARQTTINSNTSLTKITSSAGTFSFFSPERVTGQKFNDKDDVWAMACTWLYMILPLTESQIGFIIEQLRSGAINALEAPLLSGMMKGELLSLARGLFAANPETRLSARQVLSHPYFLNMPKDQAHFPVPTGALKIRGINLRMTLVPELIVRRAEILTQLLVEANIGGFSNLVYFLGVKLFDIIITENMEIIGNINIGGLEVAIVCLCLAAKIYGEMGSGSFTRFATFARRDNGVNLQNLINLERGIYEILCFDVNYSTSYDYLFLANKLERVSVLRRLLRTTLPFENTDEELAMFSISSSSFGNSRSSSSFGNSRSSSLLERFENLQGFQKVSSDNIVLR